MLISSSLSPRLSAAAAPAEAAGPRIDDIEFKVILEMRGLNAQQMNRQLSDLHWGAENCPPDCSHGADGGYYNYQRVQSPALTIANGGFHQLGEVLKRLRDAGAQPGRTGAMRILVRDSMLDDNGTTNLVNMHLANEAILYRLGQAGGTGRAVADKERWSPPLSKGSGYTGGGLSSIQTPQSAAHWKNTLSNYHWGMNAGTQGWWEFRYFDSTLEQAPAQSNVKLLLGMVRAAADGQGQWKNVQRLDTCFNKTIQRADWDALMDVAVGTNPTRDRLENNFRRSGGRLDRWSPHLNLQFRHGVLRSNAQFFGTLGGTAAGFGAALATSSAAQAVPLLAGTLGGAVVGTLIGRALQKVDAENGQAPLPVSLSFVRRHGLPAGLLAGAAVGLAFGLRSGHPLAGSALGAASGAAAGLLSRIS